MDLFDVGYFVLAMAPFVAFAFLVLYIGYLAYQNQQARDEVARTPPVTGPDPTLELSRLTTEIARQLAQGRVTLERARDAMHRGLKG